MVKIYSGRERNIYKKLFKAACKKLGIIRSNFKHIKYIKFDTYEINTADKNGKEFYSGLYVIKVELYCIGNAEFVAYFPSMENIDYRKCTIMGLGAKE